MDYRSLLKKYLDHIECTSGYTFIPESPMRDFSVEEIEELRVLARELEAEDTPS